MSCAWPTRCGRPLTANTVCPAAGNVMGGQTAYVKLRGHTIEEMLIPGTIGGMKMANGTNPKGYGARGQAPMTRMEEAALARGIYEKAQQYKAKWDAYTKSAAVGDKTAKEPDRDLGLGWWCRFLTASAWCTTTPIARTM